ncbi:MAG: PEPxxWA-CTERM sorting domain-containing protein [Phenylobacterium sp.]|uniref:trypsin-like serine protease n=1 Tax=Phenylobacterium sp. TaxID=1871053 RepID=UPI001A441ADC|nr:trypsin-like serine protease [Phenylobacterium sp.]MBL8771226.1 PEPxxWA-CTERM sorting domain-containing protein [Phenylobacterium sp.]
MTWTATSRIIGVTPTGAGTIVIPPSPTVRLGPGGDATYLPDPAQHSGVAALIMQYSNGSAFICSGSLLSDRRSIATAGHCVSSGGGVDADLVSTTAYFWDYSTQGDERVPFNPAATAVDVSQYFVNPEYTGEVIDQNDIAILRLAESAPAFAQSYELYDNGDLTGTDFNVAGYGGRSEVGGNFGVSTLPSTGFLREGDNTYDYRWGDAAFGGFFTDIIAGENFFGTAEIDFSFVSDFDNGLAAQDKSCRIAAAVGAPSGFGCDRGLGAREAGVAGGDSGGPGFVGGKLASINSYGLTFGTGFGDIRAGLNSSFGEYSGYVPIYIHTDWIAGVVPEPSTWALMIGGFGLAGSALRRRRPALAKA